MTIFQVNAETRKELGMVSTDGCMRPQAAKKNDWLSVKRRSSKDSQTAERTRLPVREGHEHRGEESLL